MRYVAAIDGGGTKTRCIIGDDTGNILADCLAGPSNHQTVGAEQVELVLTELFQRSLKESGLTEDQIEFVCLGLAGADLEQDFILLNGICRKIFNNIPFKVLNDAWLILKSGLTTPWGAVSICGTGANAAVISHKGEKAILRALSYELGNYGGGEYIAKEAMHHAFRCNEKTGPYTMLEEHLPAIFEVETMEEILDLFYPQKKDVDKYMNKIPPLVFNLARQGDAVCQMILMQMGRTLGEMLGGLIRRMEMHEMKVPVVLGGSIYNGNNPLLIDEFTTALHRIVPDAYLIFPTLSPVAGAYLIALEEIGVKLNESIRRNLGKRVSR